MPAPTQRRVILGPFQLVTRPQSRWTTEIIDSTALVQVSERASPADGPSVGVQVIPQSSGAAFKLSSTPTFK